MSTSQQQMGNEYLTHYLLERTFRKALADPDEIYAALILEHSLLCESESLSVGNLRKQLAYSTVGSREQRSNEQEA